MSPASATRFRKGASGNPKGRPRKQLPTASAFDIVLEQTLTITQNGVERELSVDEALQLRTYQDALAGSRPARREVLKMIARREKWLADKLPVKASPITMEREYEARNADEALLLLGIATEKPTPSHYGVKNELLLQLEPWVAEASFARAKRYRFDDKGIAEIRRCTRDADTILWP